MSNKSYHAPPWLRSAHAQTIGGRLLRRGGGVAFERERLETPDGDFLDLEYAHVSDVALPPDAPLVLELHGLEGSAHSGYAVEVARALASRGVRSVGLNFRSCGPEMNRQPRFYHSGETGDLRLVAAHLQSRHPGIPLGALGFSLGGNVLLKYLGEEEDRAAFQAAVAISVPYDLAACARELSHGPARVYAEFFLRSLRAKVRARRDLLAPYCDVDRALAARTFLEFDRAVTAPLHGFRDADEYYKQSSAARWLDRIRTPTLLIHAKDDPIAPAATIPQDQIRANPMLSTAWTDHGGHVGFITGPAPWRARFWAEETGAEFLALHLSR